LDAGSVYRQQIEQEVEKRLAGSARRVPRSPTGSARPEPADERIRSAECAACKTENEPDARFCKECGARLGAS